MRPQRNWVVGIGFEADLPPPNGEGEEGFLEIGRLLNRALNELAERIDGIVVLAAVPRADQIDFLLSISGDTNTSPLHLIMPHESAKRSQASADSDIDGLSVLCRTAASINVQAGRGTSESDWDDCKAWLDSVTEIRLCFCPPSNGKKAPQPPSKPTVRIEATSGTISFEGFPADAKLTDSHFDETLKTAFETPEIPDSLEKTKAEADKSAGRSAPLTRILESGSLFLNLAPSFIFGVGAALVWALPTVNLWTFVAALAAALAALGLSRLGPSQSWLSGRVVAEICRSLMASRQFLDPLFPPGADHLPTYASLIRTLSLQDAGSGNHRAIDLASARDDYLKDRLDGQIKYFHGQAEKAKTREVRIKAIFYASTIVAFVANLLGLLYYLKLAPWISFELNQRWIEGLAAWVFPAIAAGAIGFLAIHETSRRAHVYEKLAEQLAGRREVLSNLRSESSITETVRDTEHFLTAELADWLNQRLF